MHIRLLALFLAIVTALAATDTVPGPRAGASGVMRSHASARPPLDTAASFFLTELREKTAGDWAAAYRTLYPFHRHVVSRIEFVGCERITPFPASLKTLRVVGARAALVRVPGLARPVPGVAVEAHVELNWYGPRDPIVFRHTFHLVPVRGHWTWLLSPSRYRLYRDRGCPIPGLAE